MLLSTKLINYCNDKNINIEINQLSDISMYDWIDILYTCSVVQHKVTEMGTFVVYHFTSKSTDFYIKFVTLSSNGDYIIEFFEVRAIEKMVKTVEFVLT